MEMFLKKCQFVQDLQKKKKKNLCNYIQFIKLVLVYYVSLWRSRVVGNKHPLHVELHSPKKSSDKTMSFYFQP